MLNRKLDHFGLEGIGVLIVAAVLVALCGGCGASAQPTDIAQSVLTASARGLEATDVEVAERYTSRSREALEEVSSMAEFREAMRELDAAEVALRISKGKLLVTQAGLDIWVETGDDRNFVRVAKCLMGSLGRLRDAVVAAGLEVPAALNTAIDLGAHFGSQLCEEATP